MEKAETHPPPQHPLNTKVRFLTPLPSAPPRLSLLFKKTPRGSNASPYAGADTRPDRNADVVSDRYADTRPDRNADAVSDGLGSRSWRRRFQRQPTTEDDAATSIIFNQCDERRRVFRL